MPDATRSPIRIHHAGPMLLVIVALFGLTGCMTFETLIRVHRDGSGTVETTFSLKGQMLDMITSMTGESDLCDEETLREDAAKMGEGVTLTSAESLEENGQRGCRAVYAFKDINKLKISQNPSEQMPEEMNATQPPSNEDEEVIQFDFTPGSPARLVVKMPLNLKQNTGEEQAVPTDSTQRAMQLAMFRQMFEDAHVHMAVEVDGTITETNATYREGNQLILVEMDFNKLLEDEDQLARLVDANPSNPSEVKTLLEGVDGMKLETNEAVQVQFR